MKILVICNRIIILVSFLALMPATFGELLLKNNSNYTLTFSCGGSVSGSVPPCIFSNSNYQITLQPSATARVSSNGSSGAWDVVISVYMGEKVFPYSKGYGLGTVSWEGSNIGGNYCEVVAYSLVSLLTGKTSLSGEVQSIPCKTQSGTIVGYSYKNPTDSANNALLSATIINNT